MTTIKGNIHLFNNDIDTDAIIPGAYLKTTDPYELAQHCMAGINKNFPKEVIKGDIIVAGDNFGCGSSREQAPISIKYTGIKAIVAQSFARIFYRNCINIGGLIPITCENILDYVDKGDMLKINLENEEITIIKNNKNNKNKNKNKFNNIILKCNVPKGIAKEILDNGGLVNYTKNKI